MNPYGRLWQLLPGIIGAAAAQPVLAHGLLPGKGFVTGVVHPIGGWDHLLAMVAVGIISAKAGARAIWSIPLTFVCSMAVGYAAGLGSITIPWTEWGILLSVVVLGLQVALPQRHERGQLGSLYGGVILFGFCHGYAHGVEWPQQASTFWFSVGFLVATAGLHGIGVVLGRLWQQVAYPNRLFAVAGSSMVVAGLVLIGLYHLRNS
jgi:urease accessory protein